MTFAVLEGPGVTRSRSVSAAATLDGPGVTRTSAVEPTLAGTSVRLAGPGVTRSEAVAPHFTGETVTDWTLDLYHGDNKGYLGALPLAGGEQFSFRDESSKPGQLAFSVPEDDPMLVHIKARRIVRVRERGKTRFAAQLGPVSGARAVDGCRWIDFGTNRGLLGMLEDAEIRPEYGLRRNTTETVRWFGWMSRQGSWMRDWVRPHALLWSADNFHRKGQPFGSGFSKVPNLAWIGRNDVYLPRPPGTIEYFRRGYTFTDTHDAKVVYTGDDYPELWHDGVLVNATSGTSPHGWEEAYDEMWRDEAGSHVIGLKVSASPIPGPPPDLNPVAAILAMWDVDGNGKVGDPLLWTDASHWYVYAGDGEPGWPGAAIVKQVILEAQDANVLSAQRFTFSFTGTHDSHGHPWDADDRHNISYPLYSTTVADVIADISQRAGIDFAVNYDRMRIDAFKRRGSDKSGSVQLDYGDNGGNLVSHNPVTRPERFTRLFLQKADGKWKSADDADGIAAAGVIEGGFQVGSTDSADSVNVLARQQLDENAVPSTTSEAEVSSLEGPQPWTNFGIGDTIMVPDTVSGDPIKKRVLALSVDLSGEVPTKHVEFVQDLS